MKFLWGKLSGRARGPRGYDLVFVLNEEARGWVLEAISREIAAHFPGTYAFCYSPSRLPPAGAYFFAHYSFLSTALKTNPSLWDKKLLAYYTHPRDDLGFSRGEMVYALNRATRVISMCSEFGRLLVEQGVAPAKVTHILPGADPALFRPHRRGGGAVGFSTAYYPRKSPGRILEIVRAMPHRRFILLGRRWEGYERFAELRALPNFTYVEAPYADYPKHYAAMDVFVSPAVLEGGPIPLVEAMMCNAVPVASRTGIGPDIIRHGENGFLFDVDSPAEVICGLIERAFGVETDVRGTVEHVTWRACSLAVQRLLDLH